MTFFVSKLKTVEEELEQQGFAASDTAMGSSLREVTGSQSGVLPQKRTMIKVIVTLQEDHPGETSSDPLRQVFRVGEPDKVVNLPRPSEQQLVFAFDRGVQQEQLDKIVLPESGACAVLYPTFFRPTGISVDEFQAVDATTGLAKPNVKKSNGLCLFYVDSKRSHEQLTLLPSRKDQYGSSCMLEGVQLGHSDILSEEFGLLKQVDEHSQQINRLAFWVGSKNLSGSLDHFNSKFWYLYLGRREPSLGLLPATKLAKPKEVRVRMRIVVQEDGHKRMMIECSWTDFLSGQAGGAMFNNEATNQMCFADSTHGSRNPFVPYLRVHWTDDNHDDHDGLRSSAISKSQSRNMKMTHFRTRNHMHRQSSIRRKLTRFPERPCTSCGQVIEPATMWYKVYRADTTGATYYDRQEPAVVCMRAMYYLPNDYKINVNTNIKLDSSRWKTGHQIVFVKNKKTMYMSSIVDHSEKTGEHDTLKVCFANSQDENPELKITFQPEGRGRSHEIDNRQELINLRYRYQPSRALEAGEGSEHDLGGLSGLPAVGDDPHCGMVGPKNVRVRLNVQDIKDDSASTTNSVDGSANEGGFEVKLLLEASWTAFGLDNPEDTHETMRSTRINSANTLDFYPTAMSTDRSGVGRKGSLQDGEADSQLRKQLQAQEDGEPGHWTPRIYICNTAKPAATAAAEVPPVPVTDSSSDGLAYEAVKRTQSFVQRGAVKEEEETFKCKVRDIYHKAWVDQPKESVRM
jgi:hypothetical protein